MKFFKNTLIIITLLVVDFVNAKQTGTKPTTTVPITSIMPTTPTQQPTVPSAIQQTQQKQPLTQLVQPKSYAQALTIIRTQMPAHKILINNTLTQEFINFVKSLNLSDIETKALLEAGVSLHTIWTGNNEQNKQIISSLNNQVATLSQSKPIEFQKPIVPKPIIPKPTEVTRKIVPTDVVEQSFKESSSIREYLATYNLMMLLDPEEEEQIENDTRTLVRSAVMGLYEQITPIIMTSNILHIITYIRQQIGEHNLQQLRTSNQVQSFAQQLVRTHNLQGFTAGLILLSLINFDNKNFSCYLHKSAQLIVIIPQQYITSNIPNAETLSPDDQIRTCGFNPDVLVKMDNLNSDYVLQQLKVQQSQPVDKTQFITQLTSLFIPQKKDGQLISPEQDTQWLIYLSGHGRPAYNASGGTTPQTTRARVAGLAKNDFSQLIKFLNQNIDTGYLHYVTCFASGYNQTFVNEILSSLNVNFIVSSEGIGEKAVSGINIRIIFGTQEPRIRPNHPFTDFFKSLELFVSQPKEFVKTKEAKKDPIAQILRTLNPDMKEENQPFIRFPGVGVFGAFSLKQSTKILTQAIVKAHEIEQKTIDLNNINMVIVNPSRINVPINLGKTDKNESRAIMSPTLKIMTPSHQAIHVFKELNYEGTMQALLFNFVWQNNNMYTQTFIVHTLTGILYQQSGIPINPEQTNIIHNLIIQINNPSMRLDEMSANVQISFELNGNIYQASTSIMAFGDPNEFNYFKNINFTSQPSATTDMNALASKFLAPQEVNKLTKPITLNSIVKFFDSKIDQQEPSIFNQPDADNEALRKFLERSQK